MENKKLPSKQVLKDAFDEYSELGLICTTVKNCDKGGKTPNVIGWQNLKESKANWSDAVNIALVCGENSGLFCLDIDRLKTKDENKLDGVEIFQKLVEKYGELPKCPIQRTPNNGYHYFFKFEERLIEFSSKSDVIEMNDQKIKIDTRGVGGCIIVSPSVNRINKKPYVWETEFFEFYSMNDIPIMPDWIYDLIKSGKINGNYEIIYDNEENTNTYQGQERKTVENTDSDFIYDLLNLLPNTIWDNYNTWIEMGFAIYNIHNFEENITLRIWNEFSKRSNKYEGIHKLQEKIPTFKKGGNLIGLSRVINLVKNKNPEGYKKIKEIYPEEFGRYKDRNLIDLSRDDKGYADIFVREIQDNIVTINKECECYIWNKNTCLWERKHSGHISNKISEILENIVDKEISKLKKKINLISNSKEDKDIKSNLTKKLRDLYGNKRYVLSTNGSGHILQKVGPMLENDKFEEKLSKPDPDILPINNNKIVNLKTGEISDRLKEHYFTFYCPVYIDNDIDKKAIVEKFMLNICKGDRELLCYLQKQLGYFLTGRVSEKCFFIYWGAGNNGKSTLCDTLMKKILGNFWKTTTKKVLMESDKKTDGPNPELLSLNGIRMAVFSEPDEKCKLDSAQIKKLSGLDTIEGRYCHANNMTNFVPVCKIVMLTNPKPEINTNDEAMMNRLKFMPFLQKFSKIKSDDALPIDFDLVENMGTIYLNVLFTWILEGSMLWYKFGLKDIPNIVKQETDKYIQEIDSVSDFIKTRLEITGNIKHKIGVRELYNLYNNWCYNNILKPVNEVNFKKTAARYLGEPIKSNTMKYKGVIIISNVDDDGDKNKNEDKNENN